jgi:cytochrome b561
MPIHFCQKRRSTVTVSYTATAKALHWLMAVLFFGLLALGFYMHDLPLSPEKLQALFLAQVGRRHRLPARLAAPVLARHAPPAGPAGEHAEMLQLAAHAGHLALYVLMIAIPLSGWLMSSAKGFQTVWFGVLPIPDLLGKNKELGDLLQTIHMA